MMNKENYIIETPNGQMTQQTNIVPKKGAVSVTRYGDKVIEQEIKPQGNDIGSLFQNDAAVSALNSGQQADLMLKKELYNGLSQKDDIETEGNIQESGLMMMLQNQTSDIQIQQHKNLSNSDMMNSLDLIRQQNISKQIPMQDVKELEQINKITQTSRDHQAMVQSAMGAGMQLAPPDPNEIIKSRQRITQNSNRPTHGVYDAQIEPIHEQIEYKIQFDNKKEAEVKLSGPSITLPNMKPVEKEMATTSITQEPVVQTDKQKIILNQSVIQTQDNGQKVVVEKTVNPEIIAKVEEGYRRWPSTLITSQQREAAGQFMTVLVLLRQSQQEIPDLSTLMQKFPEIQKMKRGGMFKSLDKNTVKWANQQIESVRKGEKSIDTIIQQFKVLYKVDPVQNTVVGNQEEDGTVKKEVSSLETTSSTQKDTESFTQHNTKRKFILKKEKYSVQPNKSIKNKQTLKYNYLI